MRVVGVSLHRERVLGSAIVLFGGASSLSRPFGSVADLDSLGAASFRVPVRSDLHEGQAEWPLGFIPWREPISIFSRLRMERLR